MQQEAVEQTRKMMEELQQQNFEVSEATGLIGTLQQQISELEKKKLVAQSPEEIARINSELQQLRDNLSLIQNLTPGTGAETRTNRPAGKAVPSLHRYSDATVGIWYAGHKTRHFQVPAASQGNLRICPGRHLRVGGQHLRAPAEQFPRRVRKCPELCQFSR